jgi:hypothetical protein
MKDKKVMGKWISKIEVKGLKSSRVLKFYQATNDALAHLITEQELENEILKNRVRELEFSLSPKRIFVEPLAMPVPKDIPE